MSAKKLPRRWWKLAAWAALGIALPAVAANQLAANVTVKVRLVRSSGACSAVPSSDDLRVACANGPGPRGPLLPQTGDVPMGRVPMQLAGMAYGVAGEPLPLYSDGTQITTWRIVQLDNAKYVELTIAW
jgi:hypothetical protein